MNITKIIVFLTLLLLFVFPSFSQPGDIHNQSQLRSFNEVQDSINKNPKELFYRWARLQILFSPSFDLYTKSTVKLEDYALKYMDLYREFDLDSVTVMKRQPCDMCPNRPVRILNPAKEMGAFLFSNQNQLLKDLNKLTESGIELKAPKNWSKFYSANKANYLYKRGQFYYVTGKPEMALKDYLGAIEANPTLDLKRSIYLSIASHYYTSNQVNKDNKKQALKYLDLSGLSETKYEEEKINLLKSLNDSASLINYLQGKSANYLRQYIYRINERKTEEPQTVEELKAYENYKKYEMMIYNYLKESQPNITIDDLKKQMISIIEKL